MTVVLVSLDTAQCVPYRRVTGPVVGRSLRSWVTPTGTVIAAFAVPGERIADDAQVVNSREEIRLETQKGAIEGALLRAAGTQQIDMVAGAGFEPATFGL